MKKLIYSILALFIVVVGLSFTPALGHLRNFMFWGKHTIHDYKTHPTRLVSSGHHPQYWPLDSNYNKPQLPDSLLKQIEANKTHAFLVIQNGKLLFEKYWDGYDSATLSGSFSAAKSIISLLIGIAVDEGKIKSLDEPVSHYVPHFATNGLDAVTIKDLLTMSSGTNYNESDKSYFSMNAYAYYGDNEEYMIDKMKKAITPGQFWTYRSGDTQVLGLVVEKAFGKNISELVAERFMQPMGSEADALWLLDGNKKHEKAFCCFNGVARDYARFGQLVLQNGKWGDKQIVSEKYVQAATTAASYLKDPYEKDAPVDFYGYQYWIVNYKGYKVPSQNGLFGQYVYIIKEKNAVVVRLGETEVVKPIHHYQPENFTYLDAALSILK